MQSNNVHTLFFAAVLATGASADTHTVDGAGGGDFFSLTEALASGLVEDGDTVEVMPGTYVGTYVIDDAILLTAPGGPAATILDGGGAGPVLEVTAGATVERFGITGGGGDVPTGGVVLASPELAILRDNVIYENHPTGVLELPVGGVRVESGTLARIVGNDIHSNTSIKVGGVFTEALAEVDLVRNTIRGNGGPGTAAGGVLWGAEGRLVGNRITGNFGTSTGGLYVAGGIGSTPAGAVIDIFHNTIAGNWSDDPLGGAGGVYLDDGGVVTIKNTIMATNSGVPAADLQLSLDFMMPPTIGTIDLSYSHVEFPGPTAPTGSFMVPSFTLPGFIFPASATPSGPILFGDFHLDPLSPNVDAGLSGVVPQHLSQADLDGSMRELGGGPDVGAYEIGEGCPAPIVYGAGKLNSLGERPYLYTTGTPSVATNDFTVIAANLIPAKFGLMIYSFDEGYLPVPGGTLLVATPFHRLWPAQADASGEASYFIDPNVSMIGDTYHFQCWFRDPAHPDGTGVGWSNAMRVEFCD